MYLYGTYMYLYVPICTYMCLYVPICTYIYLIAIVSMVFNSTPQFSHPCSKTCSFLHINQSENTEPANSIHQSTLINPNQQETTVNIQHVRPYVYKHNSLAYKLSLRDWKIQMATREIEEIGDVGTFSCLEARH